jgi:putative cardiolipin synthase
MRFDPWRWLAALTLGGSILLQGCTSLPPLDGRVASTHIAPASESQLGRSIMPLTAAHPGLSGVVPLLRGGDAFAARIRLADAAECSLDVQYYIWHKDLSGTLLADALRRAADRGVRVRILLDDNNTSGLDAPLAGLARHANVEVRLFNPFLARQGRPLGFLFDFDRLNRRMHNKSFTADNLATIVGGRNVGDEYFDAGQDFLFVDLDALAIGPIVDAVSRDFDRYWASESSYPVEWIVPAIDPSAAADLARAAAQLEQSPAAVDYRAAVDSSPFVRDLMARRLPIEWAAVRLVSDDPAKGLGEAGADGLLWSQLMKATRDPERDLKLISPYFVPGEDGTQHLATLARRGVKVRVLTNSLEATDVAAVHAGLRQAAQGPAGRGRVAVRNQAAAVDALAGAQPRRQQRRLELEPACEDVLDRRCAALHRLVQFRSTLGPPQHRDGLRHRLAGAGPLDRRQLRARHAEPRL